MREHVFPRHLRRRYATAVEADGVYLVAADGRRYLDGCAGALVANIGYGVPEVADAIAEQARRLPFAHGSRWSSEPQKQLARLLAELAPGDLDRVVFTSGGSEGVETALKLCRQYFVETEGPDTPRRRFVGRHHSYHGATLGALSVGAPGDRKRLFAPLLTEQPRAHPCYCYRCPFDLEYPSCDIACVDHVRAVVESCDPATVAAVVVEPVVGAALGAVPAVDGYLRRLREICDDHGILLVADEVMSGLGRTGRAFAVDHWGVVPDVLVTAKGLGAGYSPLGAVVVRRPLYEAFAAGSGRFRHGFTYSGNPLACAAGVAVVRYLLRHGLIERAADLGGYLLDRLTALRRHRLVGDVRGLGLMAGIELVADGRRTPFPPEAAVAERVADAAFDRGVVLYPGRGRADHLLVGPPLTIERSEIDELVDGLDTALGQVGARLAAG